jgi:hypothetical protein
VDDRLDKDAAQLPMLDLTRFRDLQDALEQLGDSRVYEHEFLAVEPGMSMTLNLIFAQSACTRLRSFHEAILREVEASNPHAAFALNRAFAETILVLAYATDHPDYVERIMHPRAEQPKGKRRVHVAELLKHIAPVAPGFATVYDQLCEITHFGNLALWHPHHVSEPRTMNWASYPRWRREEEPLIICGQLAELSQVGAVLLHNYIGAHVLGVTRKTTN